MSIKNISRLRRAKKTRSKIKVQDSPRLSVYRSSQHFYWCLNQHYPEL